MKCGHFPSFWNTELVCSSLYVLQIESELTRGTNVASLGRCISYLHHTRWTRIRPNTVFILPHPHNLKIFHLRIKKTSVPSKGVLKNLYKSLGVNIQCSKHGPKLFYYVPLTKFWFFNVILHACKSFRTKKTSQYFDQFLLTWFRRLKRFTFSLYFTS